ncbi:MAG: carboxypeptidase-like regulatory domain-containing protein [Bacteroidetes bacterium]|nr:carboxypeptidase-like regulatory domain-containing protein [Bacteroidota bacterium]
MKKHPFTIMFLILSFLTIDSFSQEFGKATGRVLDKQTGAPLENANVYLVNTTLGSATNNAGRYTIENVPPGKYFIIVTNVGYGREQSTIQIQGNKITQLNFEMKKQAVQLSEVIVINDDDWEENLETFEEKLFGKTMFAESCEIVNPQNIKFATDNDDNFVAESDSLIEIHNNALGYKIDLLINRFVWNTSTDIGSFSFYPKFEEMQTEDADQKLMWKNNRQKAYVGSLRHFLRTIVKDSLLESEYVLFQGTVADFKFNDQLPVKLKEMPVERSEDYIRLCLPEPYLVRNNYLKMDRFDLIRNQNCVIVPQDCLIFNYDGILLNPEKIQLSGYWANQRIADALPYDYKVE